MKILSTPRFDRSIKKILKAEKIALDAAIRTLLEQPEIGQLKKGDLAGVRVHKYKWQNQQKLLAYTLDAEVDAMILLGYGTHENFYRDLKN